MDEQQQVGARIRSARQQRQLSLTEVATRAGISVATLSRVETSKQAVTVDLLVTLAPILGVPAADLLGTDRIGTDIDGLADRVAALRGDDRAQLIRATMRRTRRKDLATAVEDLLSTLDVMREELAQVAQAVRRTKR